MIWTAEKPTQPGWYWWRKKNCSPRVTELVTRYGELYDEFKKHFIADYPLGELEWSSNPIPEPEESVEAVLAKDYDELRAENERLTYRQQVIADTVGEENWSLRKQLATAQARVKELEADIKSLMTCQCEGCDNNLEDHDAFCQNCYSMINAKLDNERENLKASSKACDEREKSIMLLNARCAQVEHALGPFISGGEWGKWLAWLVEGAPNRQEGIATAKIIVSCQCAADQALTPAAEKEER